jgi:predicted Rossmann fold flavoprotein
VHEEYDIAVAGAGAAGLTAAIFASRDVRGLRIAAFDGAPRIGAKILISGGGRCNVTHFEVGAADFNGNRNSIARILRTFTVEQTVAWFREMGVALKREETGKLFPVSNRARSVVDALLESCDGVKVLAGTRVERIERAESGFTLQTSRGLARARRVILSTGGRSVPKTGSDGQGYEMARALGHSVTDLFPALVPLLVDEGHWITTISGTSVDAELSVRLVGGRIATRHRGSLLFTHAGISGPVALDISRHWIGAKRKGEKPELVANFLPGETFESLDGAFVAEAKRNPHSTVGSFLRGRLPERLLALAGQAPATLGRMTRDQRRQVVRSLIESVIPVRGDRGFEVAEVTAGGIPLTEVDLATMESRMCEGLYLCGEILDVDGRIGGFNFQWAWASGRLAGLSAAASLE